MTRIPLALAALLAAALFAGCAQGPDADPETEAPPTHTFTAREHADATEHGKNYAFEGPTDIAGGLVTLRLVNDGDEPHHMAVGRLEAGKTMADVMAAMASGQEPGWVRWVAGPGPFAPHSAGGATVTLEPGKHVLLCFVPGSDGMPHMAHGMMRELNVTAPEGPQPEAPEADRTLSLKDFSFAFDTPPAAGKQVVRIRNDGQHEHEAVLARLDEGATAQEFLAAFGPDAQGPPPGQFVGGVSTMEAGDEATVDWDLATGRYVLICFVGGEDGPHFQMGMVHEFTV